MSDHFRTRWHDLSRLLHVQWMWWNKMLELLEAWQHVDEKEAQLACDTVLDIVQDWPDNLRRFPQHKLDDYLSLPESSVVVQLASSLSLSDDIGLSEMLRLIECPHTSRLRVLELDPKFGLSDEAISLLANAPALKNLPTLAIHKGRYSRDYTVGLAGVDAIAQSPYLLNLQELRLSGIQIDDASAIAIGESAALRNLRVLQLDSNKIGDDGAKAIANQKWTQLQVLDVSTNTMGQAGLKALITSPNLKQLDTFKFINKENGEQLVHAFATYLDLPNIMHIDLTGTRISEEAASAIANSTRLDSILTLNLSRCNIGKKAIAALVSGSGLSKLINLDLSKNKIATDGLRAIAESHGLACLQKLSLRENKVTATGAAVLARAFLPSLVDLDLRGNTLRDDGLRDLAQSSLKFSKLDVGRNEVGSAGLKALVDSGRLQQLASLKLDANQIDDAGIIALAGSEQLADLGDLFIHSNKFGMDAKRALALSPFFGPDKKWWRYLEDLSREELQLVASHKGIADTDTFEREALIDALRG